jgi:hypothetical protein
MLINLTHKFLFLYFIYEISINLVSTAELFVFIWIGKQSI